MRIPVDNGFDSSLSFLRDPYRFISRRCRAHRSDFFETRLLLERTICMTGPAATRLFYSTSHLIRQGAMPGRIRKTLLGEGGVQGLDGATHIHRKAMFMSMMTADRLQNLSEIVVAEWHAFAAAWEARRTIILYEEVQKLLTRAAFAWVGLPLPEPIMARMTRDIVRLFDYAGSIGPKHWLSRAARARCDRGFAEIIRDIRSGNLRVPQSCAAQIVAGHRSIQGELLPPAVAAVELINVIRPIVAVSVYIVFLAHALHRQPDSRRRLDDQGGSYAELFVQEVRRLYPFFPAVSAYVRDEFEWEGFRFPKGRRVVLDLYGTNHDSRTWAAPDDFRPERFEQWDCAPYNFIPQGGGDHYRNHRCPGEWITMEIMKVSLRFLTQHLTYELPTQDLDIEFSRLPALPKSRVTIQNVRRRP